MGRTNDMEVEKKNIIHICIQMIMTHENMFSCVYWWVKWMMKWYSTKTYQGDARMKTKYIKRKEKKFCSPNL